MPSRIQKSRSAYKVDRYSGRGGTHFQYGFAIMTGWKSFPIWTNERNLARFGLSLPKTLPKNSPLEMSTRLENIPECGRNTLWSDPSIPTRRGLRAKCKRIKMPLYPLASTDGEKHAEFKRRRDEFIYIKVLTGAEAPYLNDGWIISKRLKRQLRLGKAKAVDREFEDRVWRFFYKMGFADLNKGHDFTIRYKAADGSFREKQVD